MEKRKQPGSGAENFLMANYSRSPVTVVRGEGVRVWDIQEREYLDFLSGIGVSNIGHCHPRVVAAINGQAERLLHCCNLYYCVPQMRLAQRLAEESIGGKVFFCNSGAEAVETAVKLARARWWRRDRKGKTGPDSPRIITFGNAFHGRTLGALAATGRYLDGFAPLPGGFLQVPFNDLAAVEAAMNEEACAVLVEPVQGEGGVIPATPAFLEGLRRLCDHHGALLVFDEIQTGMGRTGRLFAYQHYNVQPDVLLLAKALGGGLPLGAVVARGEAGEVLRPGDHGSTFGGNPVACAAAEAVLDVIRDEGLVERAERLGEYFGRLLTDIAKRYPFIRDARGIGLMQALVMDIPGGPLADACRDRGLLVNCTAERVLRFLPPLVVGKRDVDAAVSVLEKVFGALEGESMSPSRASVL